MSVVFLDVIKSAESALTGDSQLTTLLKGEYVYPWGVPGPKPLNYITFTYPGIPDRDAKLVFARRVNSGLIQLNIWSNDQKQVALIFKEIDRLLGNQMLTVQGLLMIQGAVELTMILDDPFVENLYHGVVRYEWMTWKAAP